MNKQKYHGPTFLILLSSLALADLAQPRSLSAAEEVLSVERFVADKENWSKKIENPLKVEGRISTVSKHQLRFIHCDLTFQISEENSHVAGNVRNVEVTGRIKKDKVTGKLIFLVDRLKTLPSDVEQFETKLASQKSSNPMDWYELAEWAEARGKFYADKELAEKSRRAWIKGIEFAHQALPAEDAAARFELAEKIQQLELDHRIAAELMHEGARLKWQLARTDAKLRDQFVTWLATTYPDCANPLPRHPQDLYERYVAAPLDTFRKANDTERETLIHLLYVQAELARITAVAKADGSNSSAVADALTDRLPELTTQIQLYRDQAFQWRLKSIASATRQEALELAEELSAKTQTEQARNLLRAWIQAQEKRLRADGPIGFMQLAEDYLRMVEDEPTAVKLLAEAYRLDPSFTDPGDRLKQLGYRWEGATWVKGEAPVTPLPAKPEMGRLAIGMTEADVLSQLGTPLAKSRMISGEGIDEVWSFDPRGTARLLVHLKRASAISQAKVTRIVTESQ